MTNHLRIFEPYAGILAFYDGRVPGYRIAEGENWVDSGALSLGIASYAIVDGEDALVYDTHVSLTHARRIRDALTARGARNITVVLSHWHLDHIAGNEVFADCEIIACTRTAAHMARHREAIEQGAYDGPPAILPLVMPSKTFAGQMTLRIGQRSVELLQFDIHSDDAVVLWLSDGRILLAGDTLEDTVTYVAEPENLERHLAELDRLAQLAPAHILPNHGCPDRIASGGYRPELIAATARYIPALLAMRDDEQMRSKPLRELIRADLDSGTLIYLEGYEPVHAGNVDKIANLRRG